MLPLKTREKMTKLYIPVGLVVMIGALLWINFSFNWTAVYIACGGAGIFLAGIMSMPQVKAEKTLAKHYATEKQPHKEVVVEGMVIPPKKKRELIAETVRKWNRAGLLVILAIISLYFFRESYGVSKDLVLIAAMVAFAQIFIMAFPAYQCGRRFGYFMPITAYTLRKEHHGGYYKKSPGNMSTLKAVLIVDVALFLLMAWLLLF